MWSNITNKYNPAAGGDLLFYPFIMSRQASRSSSPPRKLDVILLTNPRSPNPDNRCSAFKGPPYSTQPPKRTPRTANARTRPSGTPWPLSPAGCRNCSSACSTCKIAARVRCRRRAGSEGAVSSRCSAMWKYSWV